MTETESRNRTIRIILASSLAERAHCVGGELARGRYRRLLRLRFGNPVPRHRLRCGVELADIGQGALDIGMSHLNFDPRQHSRSVVARGCADWSNTDEFAGVGLQPIQKIAARGLCIRRLSQSWNRHTQLLRQSCRAGYTADRKRSERRQML